MEEELILKIVKPLQDEIDRLNREVQQLKVRVSELHTVNYHSINTLRMLAASRNME